MKSKVLLTILLFTTTLISLTSCISQSDDQTYKLVAPTQAELEQMPEKLNTILGTHFRDYDHNSDNAYKNIFCVNHLRSVVPECENEIEKYVAQPLDYHDTDSKSIPEWQIFEECNDPLGKFKPIHKAVWNENGGTSEQAALELFEEYSWNELVIGFNKYSAPYIDWIIEGVWNSETDHENFMEFEDGTQIYYHNGFYYSPEFAGDYGGDGYDSPLIDYVSPLDGNKYEIGYHFNNYLSDPNYCKAVIGLKETKDGFRFWSIFSIDFNIQE